MLAPPEANCSPHSERDARPARSELLALFGARCPPRSERDARLARSELLAPPEANCSPRPKRITRPARSEMLASLEAKCSPCSERITRPARSEMLAPFWWHPHTRLSGTCSPARRKQVHSLEGSNFIRPKEAGSSARRK